MNGLFVGIDIGTSGVRAIALNSYGEIAGQGAAAMTTFGSNIRDPKIWRQTVVAAYESMSKTLDGAEICAIAVDGTSGTMLALDDAGEPVAGSLMYNDPISDPAILEAISAVAPSTSAALGQNSALARAKSLRLQPDVRRVAHQADWVSGLFSGKFDLSDENNALKTGYDPVLRQWPQWIETAGMPLDCLPKVHEPGTVMAEARGALSQFFGIKPQTLIVAGTTDGCASFLATGASRPGDAVTALGTTLTIKLLSHVPVSAPEFGIYSHRLMGGWLAGGASNSGGNVIASLFSKEEVLSLTKAMKPDVETGLNLYPLTRPGERFPFNDPTYAPLMEPRPTDDVTYFQAILEGIAAIEALGYQRLQELGAPRVTCVRSVGGGASNAAWGKIRQRRMGGIDFLPALSEEAAYGSALLAMQGAKTAGRA
jgi:D-ribulokinase